MAHLQVWQIHFNVGIMTTKRCCVTQLRLRRTILNRIVIPLSWAELDGSIFKLNSSWILSHPIYQKPSFVERDTPTSANGCHFCPVPSLSLVIMNTDLNWSEGDVLFFSCYPGVLYDLVDELPLCSWGHFCWPDFSQYLVSIFSICG